ncbi:MAG TPA: hypothetical protein H9687_05380 [Firmicutes bacterium]|nr:hypothetical protein [Bacillota bacterium]
MAYSSKMRRFSRGNAALGETGERNFERDKLAAARAMKNRAPKKGR